MSEKPSVYREITIRTKDGFGADIRLAVVGMDFFEDVLSPTITGQIQVASSGGSIPDEQGANVSLYEGLKLRGGESVTIEVSPNDSDNIPIDFTTKPLYINTISDIIRESEKQYFTIHLYSREAYENSVSFLQKSYTKDAKISDHVKTIINENFIAPTTNQIDDTANKLGFLGNNSHPFVTLLMLASKSVPSTAGSGGNSASAGYFFYQTLEGFNFRSVDGLIQQEPVAQYFYTEVNTSPIDCQNESTPELPDNKFKIQDFYINRNQDLMNNILRGVYSSNRTFFNPIDFTVKPPQESFTGNEYIDKGVKNLGQRFNPTDVSLSGVNLSFTDTPGRILTETYDFGTVDKEVTRDFTQNIDEYFSQRKMRYNTLFTQDITIQVPCNTNLHAGKLVRCLFPKTQECPTDDIDQEQISGIYMIKELRHHFDPRGSYTSMRLIRDTYGLYGTNR